MKKAFTLVELLVVVGIIALLASILIPSINKAMEKAAQPLYVTGVLPTWDIHKMVEHGVNSIPKSGPKAAAQWPFSRRKMSLIQSK